MKTHAPEIVVCAALKRFLYNGGRFVPGTNEDQVALIHILASNLEIVEIPEFTETWLSKDLVVMRGQVIGKCKL